MRRRFPASLPLTVLTACALTAGALTTGAIGAGVSRAAAASRVPMPAAARAPAATATAAATGTAPRHLVALRNAAQAAEVRRAFGVKALWAWDEAAHAYRCLVSFRPPRGSTLYVSAAHAAALHLDLGRTRRPAASPGAASAPTTSLTTPPATAPGAAPLPVSVAPGPWHLVFDDDFAGSSLDGSRWTPYWFSDGSVSNETTMYAANVSVAGGLLRLALTPGSGALVSSNGKFQFSYGYVEARIFLPAAAGRIANWPAFWTDGQSWPHDGEMDVMEGLGGAACWHFHSDAGGPGGCAGGSFTGWHTYGADWQPGVVTYYYDGHEVGTITDGITAAPMYLIIENSGGSWGGPALRPATMLVDYVRVWQR